MDYEALMRKAIELAKMGEGRTSPNPPVGAILINNGEVVGEGYHRKAGQKHAEEVAIDMAGDKACGGTLIVTLEPCNMPNKKRNCTEKIIASNIKKVVIGTTDPNPEMNNRGIDRLKEAGVEIKLGILKEEAKELTEPFEKFINTGIPFVICKWAMSCDGKIATRTGESQWISCEKSREFDHHLRNIYDAIMVGAGTIRKDNPRLTCRIEGGRNPTRVVIGGKEPFYGDLNIADIEESETIIAVEESYISLWMDKLGDTDIELVSVEGYNGNVDIKALLRLLGERNIMSVLVEGGSGILGTMFDERLVDKVYVFISPLIIGGEEGYTPVGGTGIERMKKSIYLNNIKYERFDDDIMLSGYPGWE